MKNIVCTKERDNKITIKAPMSSAGTGRFTYSSENDNDYDDDSLFD